MHEPDCTIDVVVALDVVGLVAPQIGIVHTRQQHSRPLGFDDLAAIVQLHPTLVLEPVFQPVAVGMGGSGVSFAGPVLGVALKARLVVVVAAEDEKAAKAGFERSEDFDERIDARVVLHEVAGRQDEVRGQPQSIGKSAEPSDARPVVGAQVRVGDVQHGQLGHRGMTGQLVGDEAVAVWLVQGVRAQGGPRSRDRSQDPGGLPCFPTSAHGFEDTGAVRLSLRWKIVGGFGLLLLLIVVLGYVTLSLFSSLRQVQRRVFNDAVPGVVAVDEIVRSYTAQSAAVRGFLLLPSDQLLEQYRAEVTNVEGVLEESRDLFTSSREIELLDELTEAGEAFQDSVNQDVVPLAEEGRRSLAQATFSQQGAPLILQIEDLGRSLRDLQREVVVRAEEDLQSRSNQARITLVAVIIGALGLGLLLTILLPRRLSSSLSELVEAARAIGRGDFDQKIDIRSGDEVEELGHRFTEMQRALKRLQQLALQDRELEIAGAIQRNLQQRTMPSTSTVRLVPIQRQANLVGGDWYDVDVSHSALTVAVGDASGKGIAAALMATVALSVLRAERGQGASARRIIERANEALKEATEPESFTTLIYATVDLVSGQAGWMNMGHPSPFMLTSSEGSERRDGRPQGYFLEGPRNRALGWFDEPGMAETTIQLAPGDRLILYTDGFLEAKSPDGVIFGENRFAEALIRLAPLDSDELGEELVRDVERFAAGKLDDDLTMLVIEFQGARLTPEATEEGQPVGRATKTEN